MTDSSRHHSALDRALFGWVAAVWVVTAIAPRYREDWLLENLLVFVTVGALFAGRRHFTFSTRAYAMLAIFATLHLIGAHYTYSETPLGFWVRDWLGLERNHYDRFVHFAFGFLCGLPLRELLSRAAGVVPSWRGPLAIVAVLSFSGFFEALEAVAALLVSPELGAAYLGTQGDEFDAQKDTLMALSGVLLVLLSGRIIAGIKKPRRNGA